LDIWNAAPKAATDRRARLVIKLKRAAELLLGLGTIRTFSILQNRLHLTEFCLGGLIARDGEVIVSTAKLSGDSYLSHTTLLLRQVDFYVTQASAASHCRTNGS
jgi:hypothetical protein